jgi:DNA-binding transcriptional ArsR family regulator
MRKIPREWRHGRSLYCPGDEHRQRILLTFRKGERLTVGQIAEVSTLSRSTVSHHLKILRQAGVLDAEKVAKEVFLNVNKALLEETLTTVLKFVREKT